MGITHKNRLGRIFYLCSRVADNGESVYFFALRVTGTPVDKLPDGYTISEDHRGQPRLAFVPSPQTSPKPSPRSPVQPPRPQLAPCPHCGDQVPVGRFKEHLRTAHPEARPTPTASKPQTKSQPELVPCPHCRTKVREDRLARHLQRVHQKANPPTVHSTAATQSKPTASATRPEAKGQVHCERCHMIVPVTHLKDHIRSGRCAKQAQRNVARAARRAAPKEPQPPATSKYPSWVMDVQPYDCGVCYQPIYQVWTKSGTYRYFNDRELTERHRCTWPQKWDPDHP